VSSLWQVLSYDVTAERLAERLHANAAICVLQGPPGVGKSWLAKDIGELWESSGGSTILIEGDQLRADASLYPFAFAMGGLPRRLGSIGPAIAGVTRAAEALAGTAGIITATIDALAKARQLQRRDRRMFLGESEQIVLHELERLGKRRPLLVIADNLHWWDSSSLALLRHLGDPRMWEAFPFLTELRLLGVQTIEPYQSVANPEAHDALLAPSRTCRFSLPRVPREGFEHVLAALGAGAPPAPPVVDAVHSLSGGHLALAARCADRISRGETAVFLAAPDAEAFLQTLLTERMRALGKQGKQAMALLQIAALLGSTFRRDEVCCAAETEESETLKLMRYCRGEGFLEVVGGLDRFVHDIYREYFSRLDDSDTTAIYEKLSDCLRLSRPAEYQLRCLNAINAEQLSEGAALAVHAALQVDREGRDWRELPSAILDALSTDGAIAVVERVTEALRHLKRYRFGECLATLDRLPRRLPKSLAAEAEYVRTMCLMSTRSEQDRAKARLILEGWDGYVEEEPEVGMRLMLLLLYGFFHVSDKERGWALEAQIVRVLSERATFDPAAEDALYTLDRCSSGLHPPDAALVRIREAVGHFGPKDDESVLRRPIEYYRSMVNLVAKLIEHARYEEACDESRRIVQLIDEYEPGVVSRLDFAYANQIQAEYRVGAIDAREAARRQREIVARCDMDHDPYYVENPLAVYLALAGEHAEALEILDRLDAKLSRECRDAEPSMVYLLRGNRCAVRFVSGDLDGAHAEWRALTEVVRARNYVDRDIVVHRHELIGELIEAGELMSASRFDTILIERYPDRFGPLWKNFGHGFALPALELWREN
jgi:hypothetical protein